MSGASGFGSTFCLVLKRMGKWGIFKIKWVLVMNWSSHGLGFNNYIDIVPCSCEYVFFMCCWKMLYNYLKYIYNVKFVGQVLFKITFYFYKFYVIEHIMYFTFNNNTHTHMFVCVSVCVKN